VDAKTVPVKLSDDIRAIMEERGIREEDIREVLDYAESTGKKLYVEGEERYLAKKKIGNFTCNVEYAVNGGEVEVLNLYSYVILLTGQED
jgi:4Fe-4S ferredoxin iron-sulfur binding domain protein